MACLLDSPFRGQCCGALLSSSTGNDLTQHTDGWHTPFRRQRLVTLLHVVEPLWLRIPLI